MSKESYKRGFAKAAAEKGVDPAKLAGFALSKLAQHGESPKLDEFGDDPEAMPGDVLAANSVDHSGPGTASFWDGVMQSIESAVGKAKNTYDDLPEWGKTLAGIGTGTALGSAGGALIGGIAGRKAGRGAAIGALLGGAAGGASTTNWDKVIAAINAAADKQRANV